MQLTQEELEEQFPDAFSALPEPYQADSCLEFFLSSAGGGTVFAKPKPEEIPVLGDWIAFYNQTIDVWENCNYIPKDFISWPRYN